MLVKNKGIFKSIELPASFVLTKEFSRADGWLFTYRPFANADIEISIRSSGKSISRDDSEKIKREIFSLEENQLIFEEANANERSDHLLKLVSPLLGNVGDNQVANTWSDMPQFQLERLGWLRMDAHASFRVYGGFLSAGVEVVKYFDGMFIVENEHDDCLSVQELYLQAFPLSLFRQYQECFSEALASVRFR